MNSKTHSNRGFSGRLVVLVLALLMLPPVFAQERPRAEGRATLAALKRAIELLHAKSEKKSVSTGRLSTCPLLRSRMSARARVSRMRGASVSMWCCSSPESSIGNCASAAGPPTDASSL